MQLWMDVMRDIEHILEDYERLFDAWEAGGVDGLVIGPLQFGVTGWVAHTSLRQTPSGVADQPVATFDPDPRIYRRFGVEPPPAPEAFPEKRKRLEEMLAAAKTRGWSVWIFQPATGAGPGGSGPVLVDETTRAAACARMVDTLEHYPMADGGILDGPEWGYEISPHHRKYIFADLPESVAPGCAALGYDYAALVAAKDRLFDRLHSLAPPRVSLHVSGGMLGASRLLDDDPDLAAWLRYRTESMTEFFRQVKTGLDAEMSHPVKLGCGPRTAAFAPLSGYDFEQLAKCLDLLLPKHYFWHRGFDGMVGTVYRYVETLTEWNPGLSDGQAFALVQALFGLDFPGVEHRTDLETVLDSDWFERIVDRETRRALAAVDDPDRIVPWVDTGRAPHDGDPMPAGYLRRLLCAAREAGLNRFLYHHHNNLTAGEWTVISELCGEPWSPQISTYCPPDRPVL
ncbi:MAG: hypothetical protein O7G87_00910 [bacterium]|nr:hypothetical protein [bacterium]